MPTAIAHQIDASLPPAGVRDDAAPAGTIPTRRSRSPAAASPRAATAEDPVLVVMNGLRLGDCIALRHATERIGRDRAATIHLCDDSVSRRHARIERAAGGCLLVDEGSTNGSFVDGRRVRRAALADGDVIRIGDVMLRYFFGASEDRALLEALHRRASIDPLTGTWNRQHVLRRLEEALARPREQGRPTSVVLVDLDRFKPVNDRLGHAAGDRLLAGVAQAMAATLRPDGLLGRIGGDEFLVVLPGVDAEGALQVAARVAAAVAGVDVDVGRAWSNPGATLGVAVDAGTGEAAALLHRADLALLAGKRAGRGCIRLADAAQLGDATATDANRWRG